MALLFAKLKVKHGTVLVVVDQTASIRALPLAVERAMGCPVAYPPGLTMQRIADLYPGEAKTDAKDLFIIATAAQRESNAHYPWISSGGHTWRAYTRVID
ncbi:hypothetical protein ADL28_36575 [Streptomyces violaceusniger]|uniref:Transposase IS110-like N-terminal domain-containing protein n=1 Tax=Streptomyces violaceusniger TaxID=68280 RepID=A0A0X3VMB5_STRVO|nr:hypothetical protein ADL28_36575 [Streptomyces violaceusniger]